VISTGIVSDIAAKKEMEKYLDQASKDWNVWYNTPMFQDKDKFIERLLKALKEEGWECEGQAEVSLDKADQEEQGKAQETNEETGRDPGRQDGKGLGVGGGELADDGQRNGGDNDDVNGKSGGGSSYTSDKSGVGDDGKKKERGLEVGRVDFPMADSGGAASTMAGKGKGQAVDNAGDGGGGEKSRRKTRREDTEGVVQRGAASAGTGKGKERAVHTAGDGGGGKESGRKMRRGSTETLAERRTIKAGSLHAKSDGAGRMARVSPAQLGKEVKESNKELGKDSSARQQSKRGLRGIGGGQVGEASAMAVTGKERSYTSTAVDVPNDIPRFKPGDRVEAKCKKSRKYHPGKISVALDSHGQYKVTFTNGDEEEVQWSHVRLISKPRTPKNLSKPSNSRKISEIQFFCCPACKHKEVPNFIFHNMTDHLKVSYFRSETYAFETM